METVVLRSSADQTISPFKQQQNRSFRKINNHSISPPFDNFGFFPSNMHARLVYTPPPPYLSHSFPLPFSVLNPQLQPHHHQPPLLPLPVSKPINSVNSLPPRTRGFSCPPISRRVSNKNRNQSQIPKKSKPKKEGSSKNGIFKSATNQTATTTLASKCLLIESTNPLGPDPDDLPKDVSKVLSSSAGNVNVNAMDELDKFSGSAVFTTSPPPSSLPLPTFFLRPKLSCNVEGAGIDAGATDNLRRLMRL